MTRSVLKDTFSLFSSFLHCIFALILVYSRKKSVVCNSGWINGYGAVATFYRFKKNGKKTKLKKFEEIANPTALFKINGKKVSKQKYNAEMKKM